MDYANVVATISAMCAVYQTGKDVFESYYSDYLKSPNITIEAERLRSALMTYSDEEVEAIEDRIQGCRERFIKEGSGERRATCLCSVLTDVKDGNGGTIPDIDSWEETYIHLGCETR